MVQPVSQESAQDGDNGLRQAEEWKQKGNVAFRAKNFAEALNCYTEAITRNPKSQTLYSNRSAALLSLDQLPSALDDAKRAIELDSKWAKGYRRKASVLDAMKRYRESLIVYEKALEIIEVDKTLTSQSKTQEETEIKKILIGLKKKINNNVSMVYQLDVRMTLKKVDQLPSLLIVHEVDRRTEAGQEIGEWPPLGSCFRRLWVAEMQYSSAIEHLNEFHVRNVPYPHIPEGQPVIFGRLQTLEELTTAMVEDIRVARFDKPLIEKLQLCYKLEQVRRDAIGPNIPSKKVIEIYNERLQNEINAAERMHVGATGWDNVRPALQLTIRSCLMNGLLKFITNCSPYGTLDFSRCVELIETAREIWRDVDGGVRGRTLEETFLRHVKVHLGEALIRLYLENLHSYSTETKETHLNEIINIGEWLVESFENNPMPPEEEKYNAPAGEVGWWGIYYTHFVAPLAKGYSFIGFANFRRGTEIAQIPLDYIDKGKRGPLACSPSLLGIAAINYAKAAAWMPPDDPDRANALWCSVLAMVRRGGYYLADFEVIRDMATRCVGFFTPFFPANIIPESHGGKCAAGELVGTTVGGNRDLIVSPMVHWPKDVAPDEEVVKAVIGPWTNEIISGDGGGLVMLTEVVRDAWRERLEKYQEPRESMGGDEIWKGIDIELRMNWEAVKDWNQGQEMAVFMG